MEPLAIDVDSEVDTKSVQVEIQPKNDGVFVDNVASFHVSCDTRKRSTRSNSVIDSIGGADSIVPSADNTTRRTKSLFTSDYHTPDPDQDRCSIGSQVAETFVSDWVEKTSDRSDAHASFRPQNVTEDDDLIGLSSKITALMPVIKDAECYNMNHKNRGKCVIFNHEKFEKDSGFDKRKGSTADTLRLEKSFGNLGFDVEVHNDLTYDKVMSEIDKLSCFDHKDNDCLCIIVLTHGLHNDLICANDVAYKSYKIWKQFTADKCTSLAGKPKLFFFQACRGDELDSGVLLRAHSLFTDLLTSETDSVASYKIPTHADFLLAHSSVQGFYSIRNPVEGTWYIQCLCNVLDEYGTKLDLMSLLTMAARKVATDHASHNPDVPIMHDKKQVPSVTTMLIRSVYFPPKSNV